METMSNGLSASEDSQLRQTIEMFEVIAQSQPNDYQSLEILKEAYSKLGDEASVAGTSKRIAAAYVQLGQLSSAILEYESILQRNPDDPEVRSALAEIEHRAGNFGAPPTETEQLSKPAAAALAAPAAAPRPGSPKVSSSADLDDGRSGMEKVFIEQKLLSLAEFDLFWPKVAHNTTPRQPAEPFLNILAEKQVLPLDRAVRALVERSRLGYIPLEKYDVDVEFSRSFSRETCLRHCVLPFDRMSKSIMVATANPFSKQAAHDIGRDNPSRIIWYVASPGELVKFLKKVFR